MNSTYEGLPHGVLDVVIGALSYNLIVGVPANTYVLWLILRDAKLRPDIFYFNLSSGEILFSVSTIFFFVAETYHCSPCLETFAFFRGLLFTARPLFQCLICVECYVGVNHPVLFLRLKPLRHRLTCTAAGWLFVALSCFYNKYTYNNVRHLFTFFIQNVLFLLTVIFCLVSVLRTLRSTGPGENNVQNKSNRKKARAIKIISVTMASMVVNFLLFIGPIPAQLFLKMTRFWYILTICACLSYTNGSMQVFIYLQRCEKILCLRLH